MNKDAKLTLFIISDSVGETAQKVATSVLVQFPELTGHIETKRFSFMDSEEELIKILQDAVTENAIVVSTLVDDHLNKIIHDYSKNHGLSQLDYMNPLMGLVQEKTGLLPKREARAQYKLTRDYFTKIEAIEFAVKYDDGKDPKGFLKADYVILGISRTSKTPLSMYLATKVYKVANLPLIPEIPLPKELFEVPSEKIIGLLAKPEDILLTRRSRLSSLGLQEGSAYTNLEHIQAEIKYAKDIYRKLGARMINIDNMAIEETAELIISPSTTIG